MMNKAFKVRLYPNKNQATFLSKSIGCNKKMYNLLLDGCKSAYEAFKKEEEGMDEDQKKAHKFTHKPNYTAYSNLPEFSYMDEVEKRGLCYTQQNLKTAFQNFFKRRKDGVGYPVKKSFADKSGSFQSDGIKVVEGFKLRIPKCPGLVTYRNYRDIELHKMVTKTVTVSRDSAGKYFASILCEIPDIEPLPSTGKTVGIDLGVSTAVAFDDGRKIDRKSMNTKKKFFRGDRNGKDPRVDKLNKQIDFLQAKLSKAGKWNTIEFTGKDGQKHTKRVLVEASGNYNRIKKRIAQLQQRLYNIRNTFINNAARTVIDSADVICMEELDIRNKNGSGMLADSDDKTNRENATKHRNIAEASMGMLGRKIDSMAKMYGRTVVKVKPAYTTMTCSCCGARLTEKLDTKIRSWTCSKCGTHHDRDVNAARNILKNGLEKLGAA